MSEMVSLSNSQRFANIVFDFEQLIKFVELRRNLQEYADKPLFDKYSPIYTFTTENLDSYLNEFDIRGKDCLTVTSSGDQLINLALLGASNIDCFDSNKIATYFTKIKLAAIKALEYEEFLDYFCSLHAIRPNEASYLLENDNCFSLNYYSKIRKYLDEDTLLFFDLIYEKYKGDSLKIKKLFYNISDERAMYNNTYLRSKEYYSSAKKHIIDLHNKGINFYNLDIFDLPNIQKKYDLILLSNIFDYIESKKEIYAKYVKEDVCTLLNRKGNIILNYQYCYRQRKNLIINDNKAVYVKNFDKRYFNYSKIEELSDNKFILIGVPTIYRVKRQEGMEDCIYVYKK